MNMPNDEQQLARLVREAADEVQPRPALDAIRARTVPPLNGSAQKESAMSIARTWILGGLGGAVATAAVIGGVWFATTNGDDGSPEPGPIGSPSPSQTVTGSPSPAPTESESPSTSDSSEPTTPSGETVAVPVYYAGDTPDGLRLYREFARITATNPLQAAVERATSSTSAVDRDYSTLWPAGTEVNGVHFDGVGADGQITIDLSGNLHDRAGGMTERKAELAIQQLIYTAQGTARAGRVPVQFLLDGKHTDTVLGVPTSEPLANAPVLDTLSLVNLSTPAEGDVITGDTLDVSGVANSFEANVIIRLQRFEGTYIALQEPVTAEGWMGEKLFPFSKSFDISDVEPGTYTLMAMTDDPSGGAEGNGAFSDDKVITIK